MEFIKIRFSQDFEDLNSRFEDSLEDVFQSMNTFCTLSERIWKPQMDIYETQEEIIIRAELAGVEKEDLQVEISNRAVKISGRRLEVPCGDGTTYRLAEIQYGNFERLLPLPAPIDTEIVASAYINGLLQLRIAKLPMDQTHTIPVKDG